MFFTIFSFEVTRWLKQWQFYLYCGLFFAFSFFVMASSYGVFDSVKTTTVSNTYANSPIALNAMFNGFSIFIYFLLPTIVGASVYRDFKYNVHSITYSYPFTKPSYLFGKFLSSIFVVLLIIMFTSLGAYLAAFLPNVNPELVGPHKFSAYWQSYVYYIIPNLLFYGVIIFSIVTITRNIPIGFVAVIALFFIQSLLSNLLEETDNKYLLSMLDPFGMEALQYHTKYWTVYEKNNNDLPLEDIILYNRLLWFGIASLVFGIIYYFFTFSQNPLSLKKSKTQERSVKNNFGGIITLSLPKVTFDYSTLSLWKTAWNLSVFDLKYIVKNWVFIIIVGLGLLFSISTLSLSGTVFGTETLPVTWKMLSLTGGVFSVFINLMTFLFTGMILNRNRQTRMFHLTDTTPFPNWVFLVSKFFAIIKMQFLLLSIVLIAGILFQTFSGFFNYELGLYFFELYVMMLLHCIVWALLAFFVHSLVKNYLGAFFILLTLSIVISFLPLFGVEQTIFMYNADTGYDYSDMNGYGASLAPYFLYKGYWLLLGIVFYVMSLIFFVRGVGQPAGKRFKDAMQRFKKPRIAVTTLVAFLGFIGIGSTIYYNDNVINENISGQEMEKIQANFEKKYKKFEYTPQPRIIDVKINLDLFPETRDYVVNGTYLMKNKNNEAVHQIIVDYMKGTKLSFSEKTTLQVRDTVNNFNIYKLAKPLAPGATITLTFSNKNKPNNLLNNNSPINSNGTFINNMMFPTIGYNPDAELVYDEIRKKYGLKPKDRMPKPTDEVARRNTYISRDADWVYFETTVSTSGDQIAIAPGYLQKQWKKDGRNYFHYKMDQKMLNFYAYNSAKYEVKKDTWNGIPIEIYYHKGHEYNLDRMMSGVKKSMDYYTKNFTPYQHKQIRIIEFPKSSGMFAQSFANTIPFSEAIGFIAAVDDENENAVDYPFTVTSHEVAHQWFAHQVIGANVQGATLLSESLSEYSSLKVLEHTYGKSQMRRFLKDALDQYLMSRTFESIGEKPLMYNENQQYIHYNKGSLVLYALSDYIGEKNMNNAIKSYIERVAFQEAPYTNSVEFVDALDMATPDSLKYIINDMFETITLYDNKVTKATSKKLKNGKYEVTFEFDVTKYKADKEGKRIYKNDEGKTLSITKKGKSIKTNSYPLNDYIEIGIFSEETIKDKKREKALYLKKVKVTTIENKITVIVDEKPLEVGVDPYNKLIDTQSDDNRLKI